MWSSLRRIWSGGGVAYLAKAIGNTLHTVGPMSRKIKELVEYADPIKRQTFLKRVQPVVRARYAASGMLKSGSLAAYPE
jgi:hypothetical protein